jgi:hypothetical protein
MDENSNHTTRFNQTLPVKLFEGLKSLAVKRAAQGKQLKVQQLVKEAVIEYLSKHQD